MDHGRDYPSVRRLELKPRQLCADPPAVTPGLFSLYDPKRWTTVYRVWYSKSSTPMSNPEVQAASRLKKIAAAFYQTGAGREPVREWLRSLDAEDRKVIGEDIATVEYGWPVGMPKCRSLGQGLWEVRITLRNNRIARASSESCGARWCCSTVL